MRLACSLLTLIAALALSTTVRAEDPQPGRQVEQKLEVDGKTIPYLLYLPKEHATKPGGWPLLFFLHGRGESFGPLSIVAKWGPPKQAQRGDSFPFVMVSPQCPTNEAWNQPGQQALLTRLLDHAVSKFGVDPDRIYLTGLSMGGYGSWRLAADHPGRFAAVVPVCGGGKPEDAEKLKTLPIWVFHGTEDKAVPFQRSVEMVEAIKAAGGSNIRFTSLEHIGHNSWEAAYSSPELYEWLAKQKRSH
jgi:predicted peptidase